VELSPLLMAGGFLLSLAGFAWGIIVVLDRKSGERHDRMETRHREEMNAIKQEHDSIRQDITDKHYQLNLELNLELKTIHGRVDKVKDLYVKQDVHDRDIMNLRDSLSQFRTEIKQDLATGIDAFNNGLNAMRREFTDFLIKLSDRNGDSK